MSDCSTNAMKPKEPPKTCGNCGHFLIGDCVADEYRETHLYFVTDCGDWFSLEQRYQQLEQVAKDAMEYIEYLELRHDAQPTSKKARMYQQLLELGVSLDD